MKHFTLLAIFLWVLPAAAQTATEELLGDMQEVRRLIENEHVSPYWINPSSKIMEQYGRSNSIIKKVAPCNEACYVELLKYIAMLRDGHSIVTADSRYKMFGYLPFRARWFAGELYVVRVAEKYKEILGAKIVRVNGLPISEVLAKLRYVVPNANDNRFKKYVGSYIHLPGLLYGLEITDEHNKALITFSKGGAPFQVTLEDMPLAEEENTTFINYLDGKRGLPWFLRDKESYYWFDFNETDSLFYLQYNRVGNMESESVREFAERMWAEVDTLKPKKFVIDLRYNGGGSFPYSMRFIQGILDRPEINQRGKLFVITGYDTFSAALEVVNQLEAKTQAIIVGESPCDYPSRPGDPETYKLPNNLVEIQLSSLYHPSVFPGDQRKKIRLDKRIPTKWAHYSRGRDPILAYINKYERDSLFVDSASNAEAFLGRYEFDPTRDVIIQNREGELWLEISHSLHTPLYPQGDNKYATEVPGFGVALKEGYIDFFYPDGRSAKLYQKDPEALSVMEMIYAGDVESAGPVLKQIKELRPNLIDLEDHRMSFLSTMVFFELRDHPEISASEVAKGVLDLGIELNNGKAPFCEFSKQFYE